MHVKAEEFSLSGNKQEAKKVTLEKKDSSKNIVVIIPSIQLTGKFNNYFSNNIHFEKIELQSPEINFQKKNVSLAFSKRLSKIPAITIDDIIINEPVLNVLLQDSLSTKIFLLPFSKASEIKITNLKIDSDKITAGDFKLKSGKAEFINANKKVLDIDKNIDVSLEKIITHSCQTDQHGKHRKQTKFKKFRWIYF